MIDTTNFLLFMLATLTLNVTPGPDMLYIITRSLSQGRLAGIIASLGIALGCCFHIFASAFGLSQLLAQAPMAYDTVRYAGATYLAYLGLRTLLNKKPTSSDIKTVSQESLWVIFRQGVLTNALNPKAALFFLAFLPQFTQHSAGNISIQVITLGIIFNASGTIVNIGVAYIASWAGSTIRYRLNNSHFFRWLTGSIFLGFAIRLAIPDKR